MAEIAWKYLGDGRAIIHFLKPLAKQCNFTNVLFYYKGKEVIFFFKNNVNAQKKQQLSETSLFQFIIITDQRITP